MIDLSISIINWNTGDYLKKCLQSIEENVEGISYEAIVVDNNSSDGSIDMIRNCFPKIKLIENRTNLGFSRANNQAIKKAAGRYILLLNPDTLVLDKAIVKMIDFMEQHSNTGIIGCKLLNEDGSVQMSCRTFPTLNSLFHTFTGLDTKFPKSPILSHHIMSYWNHDEIREVDWVSGACLIVRHAVIKQIGLLDEQFFMYYEDLDYCRRARQKGWRIYYLPEAQIIHYRAKSTILFYEEMESISSNSLVRYYRKYHSRGKVISVKYVITIAVSIYFLWTVIKSVLVKRDLTTVKKLFSKARKRIASLIFA